jgi:hypothetical protein
MSPFLIERLMGVFWVFVQQVCYVCVKYAHDDIAGRVGGVSRLIATQICAFLALLTFCFLRELGFDGATSVFRMTRFDAYPWATRIAICSAMILFDLLLVIYFARIVRIYRRGLSAARPTLPGDVAALAAVVLLGAGYFGLGTAATERFAFTMRQYVWIGRFFIQISNFFYVGLEVGGALLFWFFLKRLRTERRGASGDA